VHAHFKHSISGFSHRRRDPVTLWTWLAVRGCAGIDQLARAADSSEPNRSPQAACLETEGIIMQANRSLDTRRKSECCEVRVKEDRTRGPRQGRVPRAWPTVVAIMTSLIVFGGASVAVSVLIPDDLAMQIASCVLGLLTMRITQAIAMRVWDKTNR